MDLQPTRTFVWSPSGKLLLVNGTQPPIAGYTDPIATNGADQIGLFVRTTPSSITGGVDANVYIRVAWAGVMDDGLTPMYFTEECVEAPGSVVNGAQRYALYVKEYGPLTTAPPVRATIWVPTAAHFFKVGCYADATANGNAAVTISVELGRTANPVQQSR